MVRLDARQRDRRTGRTGVSLRTAVSLALVAWMWFELFRLSAAGSYVAPLWPACAGVAFAIQLWLACAALGETGDPVARRDLWQVVAQLVVNVLLVVAWLTYAFTVASVHVDRFDLVIGTTAAAGTALVLIRCRRAPTGPGARLGYTVTLKAIPQVVHACAILVVGGGLSGPFLTALIAQNMLRAWWSAQAYGIERRAGTVGPMTRATFASTSLDLGSLLLMALCWLLVTL